MQQVPRLVDGALVGVVHGEVRQGLRLVAVDFEALVQHGHGLLVLADGDERRAEVVEGLRVLGEVVEHAPVARDGQFHRAALVVHRRAVHERLPLHGPVRRDARRDLVVARGDVQQAEMLRVDARAEVEPRVVRPRGDRDFEELEALLQI